MNKIHLPQLMKLKIKNSSQLKYFIEKIIDPKRLYEIDIHNFQSAEFLKDLIHFKNLRSLKVLNIDV